MQCSLQPYKVSIQLVSLDGVLVSPIRSPYNFLSVVSASAPQGHHTTSLTVVSSSDLTLSVASAEEIGHLVLVLSELQVCLCQFFFSSSVFVVVVCTSVSICVYFV